MIAAVSMVPNTTLAPAGLLWALLALLLSAERQLAAAAEAAEQGLRGCSPAQTGLLRKILANILLAQGVLSLDSKSCDREASCVQFNVVPGLVRGLTCAWQLPEGDLLFSSMLADDCRFNPARRPHCACGMLQGNVVPILTNNLDSEPRPCFQCHMQSCRPVSPAQASMLRHCSFWHSFCGEFRRPAGLPLPWQAWASCSCTIGSFRKQMCGCSWLPCTWLHSRCGQSTASNVKQSLAARGLQSEQQPFGESTLL